MKNLFKAGAIAALVFASVGANATQIQSTYTVNASTSDPGLKISTANNAVNPFTYDVTAGSPVTFDLFDIWTEENSLDFSFFTGCGDDCDPLPISVVFGFILPELGLGTVTGDTMGAFSGFLNEEGQLSWDGPEDFFYGPNGDGHIQVSLSDATFNTGFLSLDEGFGAGATVQATLNLISDATADVPEPGMIALFGLALLGLGFASNRRRAGNRG